MDVCDVAFAPVVRRQHPATEAGHPECARLPLLPVLVRRLAVDLLRVDSQACPA